LQRAWEELASPWNVNHQLSIPLQVGGGDHNTYLMQRPDRDFTEQELDLAKLLQPVLTGLASHLMVAKPNGGAALDGSAMELTFREMAILTLLSRGLTAEALARQLSISPRTAEKHLEHIYRKLDVCEDFFSSLGKVLVVGSGPGVPRRRPGSPSSFPLNLPGDRHIGDAVVVHEPEGRRQDRRQPSGHLLEGAGRDARSAPFFALVLQREYQFGCCGAAGFFGVEVQAVGAAGVQAQ
jgi:DNA-binding CsgD family transcriptional regulator